MVHKFADSKREGDKGEEQQDAFYRKWFHIDPVDLPTDKKGIDRRFRARHCPYEWNVQYKLDRRAQSSGNLAIEVVSVTTSGKAGWAILCGADVISVVLPEHKKYYLLSVTLLRMWVPAWLLKYPIRPSPNDGYETMNLLVPCKIIAVSTPCLGVFEEGVVRTDHQMNMAWAMEA
jgi:hypothetical protein